MAYVIHQTGESPSFPAGDAFLLGASADGEVVLHLGNHLGAFDADDSKAAVLVELGTECLGVHTGEAAGEEGSNVLGFARYRNGSEAPSPADRAGAPAATPSRRRSRRRGPCSRPPASRWWCAPTRPGASSIALVRPKYNAALRFLDEGLATRQGHGRDLPARPRLSATDRSSGSSAAASPTTTT